jgi:hypothetical protein
MLFLHPRQDQIITQTWIRIHFLTSVLGFHQPTYFNIEMIWQSQTPTDPEQDHLHKVVNLQSIIHQNASSKNISPKEIHLLIRQGSIENYFCT